MKIIYILGLWGIFCFPVSAQTLFKYYIMPYEVSTMESKQLRENTYSFINDDFNRYFKGVIIRKVELTFPEIKSDYLKKIYTLTVENEAHLVDRLLQNPWIEHVEYIEEPQLMNSHPNDYSLPNSNTNHYLDLVRAPFAWSITKGDSNILVGVADSYFTFKHEELKNKIVEDLNPGKAFRDNYSHGTEVAGIIAGETNNQLGTASLGYNTKMIAYSDGVNLQAIERLSRKPGVRVINMSWSSHYQSLVAESLCNYLRDSLNIVLVGAAGNRDSIIVNPDRNHYRYPASYESVISVSGVGSRFPRGTNDAHYGRYNWEDVAEAFIGDSESTMTVNDKVDISAPAFDLLRATNTLGETGSVDTYADHGLGTSTSAPLVSAAAALIFAVNPSLTAKQVKQILLDTADDIDVIPENTPYRGRLGSGRLNAYRAVLTAECMANPSEKLDLMIQDRRDDFGIEPNISTDYFWESPSIWVRNQRDGKNIRTNENPEYDANGYSYIYVKVVNKSCVTSSGVDKLKLYWSKAASNSHWPRNWNGSYYYQGALMGDQVGSLNIPILQPGQEIILELPWRVPNPALYPNVDENGDNLPWHFCLLARIESTADPMTFLESTDIVYNVKYNNNIAWKNVSVVDLFPDSPKSDFGATIAVGTKFNTMKNIHLDLEVENTPYNLQLFNSMDVVLSMDKFLYKAWKNREMEDQGLKLISGNKFLVSKSKTKLENIRFGEEETGLLALSFNFKTDEAIHEDTPFIYRVIQRDGHTNEIIGGETFEIRKQKLGFLENTIDLTVEISKPKSDNTLLAIAPNPSSGQLTIGYDASSCKQAYLMIKPIYGVFENPQTIKLDPEKKATLYDVSEYQSGVYKVLLYCDGKLVDSKSLMVKK